MKKEEKEKRREKKNLLCRLERDLGRQLMRSEIYVTSGSVGCVRIQVESKPPHTSVLLFFSFYLSMFSFLAQ